MLYILNKTSEEAIQQLKIIGAEDNGKDVLLVTDAVFLATEANIKRFEGLDVEHFYAAEDAVEARVITPASNVKIVDYDDMAELLEDAEKIIVL
jgi:sulfur relay protein TusB/DsrH